jgi:Family of unknown function (DUF6295)
MCTYATEHVRLVGGAKGGPGGWRGLGPTTVYFDHPVHAQALHTLNIDFGDPAGDPSARIALELTAESARELVAVIERALGERPPRAAGLSSRPQTRRPSSPPAHRFVRLCRVRLLAPLPAARAVRGGDGR